MHIRIYEYENCHYNHICKKNDTTYKFIGGKGTHAKMGCFTLITAKFLPTSNVREDMLKDFEIFAISLDVKHFVAVKLYSAGRKSNVSGRWLLMSEEVVTVSPRRELNFWLSPNPNTQHNNNATVNMLGLKRKVVSFDMKQITKNSFFSTISNKIFRSLKQNFFVFSNAIVSFSPIFSNIYHDYKKIDKNKKKKMYLILCIYEVNHRTNSYQFSDQVRRLWLAVYQIRCFQHFFSLKIFKKNFRLKNVENDLLKFYLKV
ncbi:hypothetical protein RFI_17610 [Reticulomyxa filosa]|uniref:Uncharacterized protein n=1 Tax=Reticulomyxa filosa TaxID=46433 RepID=X6N1K4_RETFI|nr:hypothetical protein RFI_17610 [Reticulomyxa filosa]|eukprot:ETO19619.1 hypothetical protein RFI_17610 [Reticulomyxa filosa]